MKIIFSTKGFTLPELLVSMGIFLVILGLTIANFRGGNQTSELKLKALEVSENIRRVQNNALVALPQASGTIPDRYGIHFASGTAQYIIFADRASTGQPFFYEASEKLEDIKLGTNFTIAGMNDPEYMDCSGKILNGTLDIVFVVPGGQTYFNGVQPLSDPETGACGDYNPGRVEIKHKKSGRNVNVMLNWISGQISTSDISN
jgi:prepilin-type N-terminal cleavage/methylation domain-containing protein